MYDGPADCPEEVPPSDEASVARSDSQPTHTFLRIFSGPALPMATVDIKNPEITSLRFQNSHSHHQPYHLNNMLSHSGLVRRDKKSKNKKKKLTKADIGTPSNFQ